MEKNILIRVYCGLSIEDKCSKALHPLSEVKKANEIISLNESKDVYSNSPDFVSTIKYVCEEKGINCEFFLDGQSCGNDIEVIFENFNKSFELLDELISKYSFVLVSEKQPPNNVEVLAKDPNGVTHLCRWRPAYNIFTCQSKKEKSDDWSWKLI